MKSMLPTLGEPSSRSGGRKSPGAGDMGIEMEKDEETERANIAFVSVLRLVCVALCE